MCIYPYRFSFSPPSLFPPLRPPSIISFPCSLLPLPLICPVLSPSSPFPLSIYYPLLLFLLSPFSLFLSTLLLSLPLDLLPPHLFLCILFYSLPSSSPSLFLYLSLVQLFEAKANGLHGDVESLSRYEMRASLGALWGDVGSVAGQMTSLARSVGEGARRALGWGDADALAEALQGEHTVTVDDYVRHLASFLNVPKDTLTSTETLRHYMARQAAAHTRSALEELTRGAPSAADPGADDALTPVPTPEQQNGGVVASEAAVLAVPRDDHPSCQ